MGSFSNMTTMELAFWIIAIIGSVVFILLFILSLAGADADADMDVDMEVEADTGIGLQFFTFKNVMAFFTLFGWTGIVCLDNGLSNTASILIASVAGLLMMTLMAFLFFWMSKLAEDGSLKIINAVGAVGEVYLSIGSNRSKIGKISIDVQGSRRELSALTDEDITLKQGDVIKVLGVVSGEILLVEKLKN